MIVLLHPIGLDRRCWGWMADETGIRHEFPGHGLRSAIRGDISLTDLADDLLRRTPEEPLDLVGVSLGGAVALQFSLRYPLRVRSLLVACSTGAEEHDSLIRRAEEASGSNVSGVTEGTLQRWFTPNALLVGGPAVSYARSCLGSTDRLSLAATWRALADHNILDQAAKIAAPTTLVAGLKDQAVGVWELEALRSVLPTSRLATIDGPHMLPLECPGQFREAVSQHLQWLESF